MALKTYLCVKNDNSLWVVKLDSEQRACWLFEFLAWQAGKAPTLEGDAVYGWAEKNATEIEAIFPYDEAAQTASLRRADAIEVSELMDDVRLF